MTKFTRIRLLSSVRSNVYLQIATLGKLALTDFAFEGHSITVSAHQMNVQRRLIRRLVIAYVTRIRLLSSVNSKVSLQVVPLPESPVAQVALEKLFFSVKIQVHVQTVLLRKFPVANVARVGLLSRVHPDVFIKFAFETARVIAEIADVPFWSTVQPMAVRAGVIA